MRDEYMMETNYRFRSMTGRLLVATSSHVGDCFEKSLIYLCAHDENGAVGVIVNQRIGSLVITDAANNNNITTPEVDNKLLAKPFPVVFGGPVESNRLLVLSLDKKQQKNFDVARELTIHTDCDRFLVEYLGRKRKDKFLIAKGVAMWEPQQLDYELANNYWLITDPTAELIFSQRVKDKWGRVIKKIGMKDIENIVHYTGEA